MAFHKTRVPRRRIVQVSYRTAILEHVGPYTSRIIFYLDKINGLMNEYDDSDTMTRNEIEEDFKQLNIRKKFICVSDNVNTIFTELHG